MDTPIVGSAAVAATITGRAAAALHGAKWVDETARATRITKQDLLSLVDRYPGSRGNKSARLLIDVMDAGAESPRESWLRIVLIKGGLPRPTTQIRVTDGHCLAYLDMGWEIPMIAVEYDGDHRRTCHTGPRSTWLHAKAGTEKPGS
ncbi:hypothetical protein [Mycobacterium sp.]|uniref:hypothetical protein n=1 Tax=Mycobacterium sp. TaxID=1785 RepID=UPI003D0F7FC0